MQKTIEDHLFRLVYVVRNAACYEALSQYKDEFEQNWWILIYNNFFDIAILEWCKVFGTDSEPTHWKNLIADHDAFRQGLLSALGTDQASYAAYWETMMSYRNELLAHRFTNPSVKNYPTLDFALKSSFYYYSILIKMLKRYPDDLKDYYDRSFRQAVKFAELSYHSTKALKESVDVNIVM